MSGPPTGQRSLEEALTRVSRVRCIPSTPAFVDARRPVKKVCLTRAIGTIEPAPAIKAVPRYKHGRAARRRTVERSQIRARRMRPREQRRAAWLPVCIDGLSWACGGAPRAEHASSVVEESTEGELVDPSAPGEGPSRATARGEPASDGCQVFGSVRCYPDDHSIAGCCERRWRVCPGDAERRERELAEREQREQERAEYARVESASLRHLPAARGDQEPTGQAPLDGIVFRFRGPTVEEAGRALHRQITGATRPLALMELRCGSALPGRRRRGRSSGWPSASPARGLRPLVSFEP